jgi:hypothetical protein
MILVETPVFTRQINQLLSVESYRALQVALVDDPARGARIRGSGGLRKVRWEGTLGRKRPGAQWRHPGDLLLAARPGLDSPAAGLSKE